MNKSYEPCKSCQTLKEQLTIANIEKKQLLETILDFAKPVANEREEINIREIKPIKPKAIPWRIRQQALERESRIEARARAEYNKDIEKLEEELGVKEDASEISETV